MKDLFCIFLLLFSMSAFASQEKISLLRLPVSPDTVIMTNGIQDSSASHVSSKQENKRLIAAILAFPVPFGVLGLHRIYLGSEPWVPVVYILTLGGAGIIAAIDFYEILTVDDATFATFENNPNVFMWGK